MKKSVLVTLADRQFLDQAKQLFASAYLAGGWDGDYLLLAHDLSDEETKPFRERGILVENCPALYPDLPTESRQGDNVWPGIVWSKFYLLDEKFKRWEQVVFLDSDIIVTHSLAELAVVEGFAAVTDFSPKLRSRFSVSLQGDFKYLKSPAFNSGVLAYHTNIIKSDSFSRLLELARRYAPVAHGDEAIFNLFFYRQWQSLSFVYNLPVFFWIKFCRWPAERIKGVVLHFIGREDEAKPWSRDNFFYPRWYANLERFSTIDFTQIPPPAAEFPEAEIPTLARRLRWRKFLYYYPEVNYQLGQIGLKLKRSNPQLYYQLKKIKDAIPFFGHRAGA